MRRFWYFLTLSLFFSISKGQTIKGIVEGPDHKALARATVLVRGPDTARILAYALTDGTGSFSISVGKIPYRTFFIEVRHIGYSNVIKPVDTTVIGWRQISAFILDPVPAELKEVVIKREMPVAIRGDTVVYNAGSYMTPEVKKVEDLLSNMQGFSVDGAGRITFNGKRVEKVLIDGEDLTGKGYQLITKNLNAQFVEKVEVINDYTDNRLLRNVERSNLVGVNLRIKNKFLDKVSVDTELGAGVNKRYNAEANAFLLSNRLKLFSFLSVNNIAGDAGGNLSAFYEEEAIGSIPEVGEMDAGILDVGRIARPPIAEKYTLGNNDLGGAILTSSKLGRYAKIRVQAGYTGRSVQAVSSSDVSTLIDPQNNWVVQNEMAERDRSSAVQVKMALHADDQEKAVDDYYLETLLRQVGDRFSNIATGAIADSLGEQIDNGLMRLRMGWNASRAVDQGRLFLFSTDLDLRGIDQDFTNRSGRYAGLFGLDSSYDKNYQGLDLQWLRFNAEGSWGAKRKRFNYRYGFYTRSELAGYSATTVIASNTNDTSGGITTGMTDLLAGSFVRGTVTTGKSGRIVVHLRPGVECYRFENAWDVLFGFDASLNYVHSFSALRVFRAGLSGMRHAPTASMSYPGLLITGNASVLGSMDYDGPATRYQLQTSYHANNIYKQLNWSVNLSVSLGAAQYNHFILAKPEYTVDYLRRSSGNHSAFFIFNLERYVRPVSGKMGIKLLASGLQSMISINGKGSASSSQSVQSEMWWVSGFRIPVNLETKFRAGYYAGSWSEGEVNRLWQYGWSQKVKWKIGKSLYSSIIWNGNCLSPGLVFHGLDFFLTNTFRRCNVSLRGHNLLNTGRIQERTVQPYSVSSSVFRLNARYLLFSIGWQW